MRTLLSWTTVRLAPIAFVAAGVALGGCGADPQPNTIRIFVDASGGNDTGSGVDTVADDTAVASDTAAEDVAVADTAEPADTADTAVAQDTAVAADTDGPEVTTPMPCTLDTSKGRTGKECPDDQACVAPVGGCKGTVIGQCKPVISSCPDGGSPVCDCNGKTWSSACEAQKALATVASDGACVSTGPAPCGGNTGKTCPNGQMCDPTACGANTAGVCVVDPTGGPCPNGGTPECGCDDKTYPNACYRLLAGVTKKSTGECPADPGASLCKIGPAGKPLTICPTGTWCRVYPTNPIPCTGEGECVPVPPVCDNTVAPVCACNFQSYDNPCKAQLAMANVKSQGVCGGGGCTEGQGACGPTQYCAVPQGQCGGQGVCIAKADPTSCGFDVAPVCGCDNKTYSNPGCAAVAGVVVKSNGACN